MNNQKQFNKSFDKQQNQQGDKQADDSIGESRGMSNHSHDLIHELSIRLDSQWRYNQFIENAQAMNMPEAVRMFERFKREGQQAINELRDHIALMAREGTFR
jgi:hypothetical protein